MRLTETDLFNDFYDMLKESNFPGDVKVSMGLHLLLIFINDNKRGFVEWCAELAKGLPEKEDE